MPHDQSKSIPETRAEIIAQFTERADELETQAAAIPDSRYQPWHVVSKSGFPLKFVFGADGFVSEVSSANFETATHLTRVNAEHLAPKTWDGNMQPGRALTRRDAMLEQAADLRKGADSLRGPQ